MAMHMIPVTHTPGRHCASTALADLVHFQGLPWSEAFCFGIGCGLGIWYLDTGRVSPGRLVHVRSADIEAQFFRRIGQSFDWQRFEDPSGSERALCEALDQGNPVLIQTDIYFLPHFDKSAHFPGHAVVVWGYDAEKRVFVITDTEHPDLIEVPFDDMIKARYYTLGFFDIRGNMFVPGPLSLPDNLNAVIENAVIDNSRSLKGSVEGHYGLAALKTWMADLKEWKSLEDWRWTARFISQVIEKRGTGGGGFRLMYADFLEEAAVLLPAIAEDGLPGLMKQAGHAWRTLSLELRKISDADEFSAEAIRDTVAAVVQAESAYHTAVDGIRRS